MSYTLTWYFLNVLLPTLQKHTEWLPVDASVGTEHLNLLSGGPWANQFLLIPPLFPSSPFLWVIPVLIKSLENVIKVWRLQDKGFTTLYNITVPLNTSHEKSSLCSASWVVSRKILSTATQYDTVSGFCRITPEQNYLPINS